MDKIVAKKALDLEIKRGRAIVNLVDHILNLEVGLCKWENDMYTFYNKLTNYIQIVYICQS